MKCWAHSRDLFGFWFFFFIGRMITDLRHHKISQKYESNCLHKVSPGSRNAILVRVESNSILFMENFGEFYHYRPLIFDYNIVLSDGLQKCWSKLNEWNQNRFKVIQTPISFTENTVILYNLLWSMGPSTTASSILGWKSWPVNIVMAIDNIIIVELILFDYLLSRPENIGQRCRQS